MSRFTGRAWAGIPVIIDKLEWSWRPCNPRDIPRLITTPSRFKKFKMDKEWTEKILGFGRMQFRKYGYQPQYVYEYEKQSKKRRRRDEDEDESRKKRRLNPNEKISRKRPRPIYFRQFLHQRPSSKRRKITYRYHQSEENEDDDLQNVKETSDQEQSESKQIVTSLDDTDSDEDDDLKAMKSKDQNGDEDDILQNESQKASSKLPNMRMRNNKVSGSNDNGIQSINNTEQTAIASSNVPNNADNARNNQKRYVTRGTQTELKWLPPPQSESKQIENNDDVLADSESNNEIEEKKIEQKENASNNSNQDVQNDESKWNCHNCTFKNKANAKVCKMCTVKRKKEVESPKEIEKDSLSDSLDATCDDDDDDRDSVAEKKNVSKVAKDSSVRSKKRKLEQLNDDNDDKNEDNNARVYIFDPPRRVKRRKLSKKEHARKSKDENDDENKDHDSIVDTSKGDVAKTKAKSMPKRIPATKSAQHRNESNEESEQINKKSKEVNQSEKPTKEQQNMKLNDENEDKDKNQDDDLFYPKVPKDDENEIKCTKSEKMEKADSPKAYFAKNLFLKTPVKVPEDYVTPKTEVKDREGSKIVSCTFSDGEKFAFNSAAKKPIIRKQSNMRKRSMSKSMCVKGNKVNNNQNSSKNVTKSSKNVVQKSPSRRNRKAKAAPCWRAKPRSRNK